MQIRTHRKTDTGYGLSIEAEIDSEAQARALLAAFDTFGGVPTEIGRDPETGELTGVAVLGFAFGPLPDPDSLPEDAEPLSEADYIVSQVREAGLLIQSALDAAQPVAVGELLPTEGQTIELG